MLQTVHKLSANPDSIHLVNQLASDGLKPTAKTQREYRDTLGRFATGVTLVTANASDGPIGITVNSFASVSLDPALVLWSVDKKSGRYQAFKEAKYFAVHVLAQDQQQRALDFAKDASAFNSDDWAIGEENLPIARDAVARFECATDAVHDAGDHSIIIGRVLRFSQAQGEPLVFTSGKFGSFMSQPDT